MNWCESSNTDNCFDISLPEEQTAVLMQAVNEYNFDRVCEGEQIDGAHENLLKDIDVDTDLLLTGYDSIDIQHLAAALLHFANRTSAVASNIPVQVEAVVDLARARCDEGEMALELHKSLLEICAYSDRNTA
jgi:hypothetical protein